MPGQSVGGWVGEGASDGDGKGGDGGVERQHRNSNNKKDKTHKSYKIFLKNILKYKNKLL